MESLAIVPLNQVHKRHVFPKKLIQISHPKQLLEKNEVKNPKIRKSY